MRCLLCLHGPNLSLLNLVLKLSFFSRLQETPPAFQLVASINTETPSTIYNLQFNVLKIPALFTFYLLLHDNFLTPDYLIPRYDSRWYKNAIKSE